MKTYYQPLHRLLRRSVLFGLLLFSLQTFAGDKNWTGAVSSDWNDPNNWQGNSFPGNANNAKIDASQYTNPPVISANSTHSFKQLKVQNGGVLTIQADLNIKDIIMVDGGTINMSAGTLSISSGNKNITLKGGGAINVTGGSIIGTGTFDITDASFTMSESTGTSSLTINSTLTVLAASASASFTMSAGTVTIPTSVTLDGNNKSNNGYVASLNISGGAFTNNGPTYFVRNDNDLTPINISGGTVTLAGVVQDNTSGKINITVSNGSLIFQNNFTMESGDSLKMTGGTVTFEGGNRAWANAGVLLATGGTIVFNDPTATTISGNGSWQFYNVTINSGMTLTQSTSSINISNNWTNNGGTFNEGTNTVVFNGTGAQAISTAETFYGLQTNKSAGTLTLANNVTVSNTLTMTQGNINTGSNKITVGTSTSNVGTLSYTAGAVIGQYEKWIGSAGAITFPVGTASYYRPATVTFTNLTAGSIIGQFVASDPGSSGLTLIEGGANVNSQFTEGYWDFSAANSLASTNYQVQLTATSFTSHTLQTNSRVIKRTNSGSAWTLDGTHVPVSGSVAARSGLNGIATAQFGIGDVACTAPTATITQALTTPVGQGSTNNQILRIAVSTYGTSCIDNITQFNFSTAGTPGCTAASSDITNAKVYYTGTSSTFSTSTLFGSLGSAPNGSFTINGSQQITNDLVYFWLTYDISSSATRTNVVDAKLVSFVEGANTVSSGMTTPDPAGSRSIIAERYSVANGNWNATSTWAYVSGGSPGASVPAATDNVFIESGYTVTVAATGMVAKYVYITSGGSAAKLDITTGALTCDSISMTTTNKKSELYVESTGALTVNGNVTVNTTNLNEDANSGFYITGSAIVTINGNLTLTNPSSKKFVCLWNGTSLTTVTGNITFNGSVSDKTHLGMGGTARLNIKGALQIASGKYGKLYNSDGAHTSIINFNGTSAQTLELTPSASNSTMWQYSNVWINNPAGVTLNANITLGPTYATVQHELIVKSGILKSGGYSIQFPNSTSSLFQVDNGATYYTTSTGTYGGIPYFGTNQNNGTITLGATSTVNFAATSAQTIPGLSGVDASPYGNVILSGSGTKTLGKPHHNDYSNGTGNLDVNGNLTIADGVTLDVSASNYNVNVAGNWTDQNSVADAGLVERSGTVTFDGSSAQTLTLTASPLTFYRLTNNKSGGTLTISGGDVVVSNTLTMTSGNINTGSNKLTLGTGTGNVGTLSRTSGTVIGKFERWVNSTGTNIIFPVGTVTYYRPDTLIFTNLTSGSMIVEFVASNPGTNGLPLTEGAVNVGSVFTEGYWSHTAANSLASTNYEIRLNPNGFTSNTLGSNTRILKRANSSSAWTFNGTHSNATASSARRTGLSGFSEFALGVSSCSPPVVPNLTVTTHPCNNSANGAISNSVSGGTSPYTYLWSSGATTQNISGLTEGTYTVTVSDANLCSATASAAVGVQVSMAVTNMTNEDSPDGAIDVTVSGGNAPYTFLWSDQGTTVTTEDRTNISNGYYNLTVTDAMGCRTVKSTLLAWMDTIKAGSYIVDMGVSPQTFGNGLKPFGFIYDMIRNQQVPVKWSINPDKTLYGTDFSHNGVDYKGGPFIIEYEYLDNTIDSRIAYWETQGMVGDYTVSDIIVPIYATIAGFSNLGIDEANEGLVIPYFTNASVPSDIYYVGLPNSLASCDNAYVLPHADPDWTNHHYLKDFVESGGFFWSGCHAVSMYEGIYNPSDTSQKLNFLSKTGLQCYSSGKCGFVSEVHGTPTTPYSINSTFAAHPLMQNMGDMTPSQENGSEQWYIPVSTGGWNPGTIRAITTSDGSVGKEGVKLAFGRGYDDKDNGIVMYQGGHSSDGKGTTESQVAFQRSFFDFILMSSIERKLVASMDHPEQMAEGTSDTFSVSVTSGGAPFTYEWSTNVNGSFSNDTGATTSFTLNVGNGRPYARVSVKVTDACGRIYFKTVTISVLYVGDIITSDYNGYNISCKDGNDGSISLVPNGGTPPYTYNWSHGATTQNVSGLSAGTYYVTITDAAPVSLYDTITLTEPATAVAASVSGTDSLLCYADNNGSVDLTPSGGVAPYTYNWSSGNATQDLTNKTAGTYDVTVTDDNGCSALASHTIYQPVIITINSSGTDATCNGNSDGSISTAVTGGIAPYAYNWSTGATVTNIAGLSANNYSITVTDWNSCQMVDTITVSEPAMLTASLNITDVTCNGGEDGVIQVNPSGGTSPFSYLYFAGTDPLPIDSNNAIVISAGTSSITDIAALNVTVIVTDAIGCTATSSGSVGEPNAWDITHSVTDVACTGDASGAIDLSVTGNTSPYSYGWSDGNTTQDLSSVNAGTYTVTVTDNNGCTFSDSYSVAEPAAALSASINGTAVKCSGGSDGAADLTMSGGTGSLYYSWSNGSTTEDISGISAGSYTVTVTDDNSCTTSETVLISELVLSLSASASDASCNGGSDGSINLTASGGTAPYSYSWSTGAVSEDVNGLSAATYDVTVTDDNSCTATHSTAVGEATALAASISGVSVTCSGGNSGSANLSVSGGTSPYAYSWSNSATTEDLSNIPIGNYTVTVTDNHSCTTTASTSISQDALSASIVKSDACLGGANGSADLTPTGGTTPYLYIWSNTATTQDANNLVAGSYTVTVMESGHGCWTTASTTIVNLSTTLDLTTIVSNATTEGGSDGSIDLSVSGDQPPFTYAWSNAATTQDISGLTAGNYTVTVTDVNGCSATQSDTILQPCTCVWGGTLSTQWTHPGNWLNNTVPTQYCDVTIPAGTPFACNLNGNAECQNISINNSASLTIPGSQQLEIYGNFTNNGTFTPGNGKVYFLGSSEQTIGGSAKTTFYRLFIDNSSATGIALNKSVVVNNLLSFINGHIITNSDTVIITNNDPNAITNFSSSNFVVGKLCRFIDSSGDRGYDFPVGDHPVPTRYFRAQIKTHNLQGTQNLTVWFDSLKNHTNEQMLTAFTSPPDDFASYYNTDSIQTIEVVNGDTTTTSVDTYVNDVLLGGSANQTQLEQQVQNWMKEQYSIASLYEEDGIAYDFIAPEGIWSFEPDEQPTGGYYHMILFIENLSGLEDDMFGVVKRPTGTDGRYWGGGGGIMKPFGGEGRRKSDGYAMRMYLTTFSEGGGGGGSGAGLPIELLDFDAQLKDNEVEITWVTATEINNDFFTIEKSNGEEFKEVAIVPGAGNSSTVSYYSDMDYDPYPGISYYRLKQTDFDGKFTYSDVVSVQYYPSESQDNQVIVFPNPSNGEFSVVIKNPADKVVLTLYDQKGGVAYTETLNAESPNYTRLLNLKNYDYGVYFLKIEVGHETFYTKKLILH